MIKCKVIVKVCNEAGRMGLSEIKGLKEGTIVDGRLYGNGSFHFKWHDKIERLIVGYNAKRLTKGIEI